MRWSVGLSWVGAVVAAACSSAPMPAVPADPVAALEFGASLLESEPTQARRVLDSIEPTALGRTDQERLELFHAESLAATGDLWDAWVEVRSFQDRNRFSPVQAGIQDLHYRIGSALMARDASYFIFGSDRSDGRIVLREFVARYPTDPDAASALQLLGEDAFENANWDDARRRYEQIIADHPDSEWLPLAHFRRAMAEFAALIGPAYDLPSMRRARNELRDYLAVRKPERPDFREPATSALATVEEWIGTRYLLDAAFYRTLGNRPGEVYWLEQFVTELPSDPRLDAVRSRMTDAPGSHP